ncbi:succinate dehydrogenase, cytochrome b556 subunit [Candidatus Saganbacteria bacterium]|uniref:Succinate dehydrogenase, cytochrome b556 subunit n=1 Tax=Candidatus Saganbacteria bacterium TaxID=2575572 RepID=A0A9D6YUY6_UNCSA|nr:succinate dehydrogenase, cytochrome b556 subunit [Candidatus Saganbacteria bacterium]
MNLKEEARIALGSGVGMWAFLLHRLTGLALIFYLLLHITVISTSLSGADTFNRLLAVLTSPFFLTLDLGLRAAVLIPGLNGARIVLFDTGVGIRAQKAIFWGVMLITVILWAATFYFTLPHILITNPHPSSFNQEGIKK